MNTTSFQSRTDDYYVQTGLKKIKWNNAESYIRRGANILANSEVAVEVVQAFEDRYILRVSAPVPGNFDRDNQPCGEDLHYIVNFDGANLRDIEVIGWFFNHTSNPGAEKWTFFGSTARPYRRSVCKSFIVMLLASIIKGKAIGNGEAIKSLHEALMNREDNRCAC